MLTIKKRKEFLKRLGLTYDKAGITKLQNKYFTRSKDKTRKYDKNTDTLLRHVINVECHTKNFEPEEFKCECGGRYCTGYPDRMKVKELKLLQEIRDHYKKPVIVTSGLRCERYNAELAGSVPNSPHLTGYATDFYMAGVTDTPERRQLAISHIKKMRYHHYSYGSLCKDSGGVYRVSRNMGNAIHVDAR